MGIRHLPRANATKSTLRVDNSLSLWLIASFSFIFFREFDFSVFCFKFANTVVDQIHDLTTGTAVIVFRNIMKLLKHICVDSNTDMFLFFHNHAPLKMH